MKKIAGILWVIFPMMIWSQSIQLEEIMKGEDFVGNQPENIRWSQDGKTILFDWNPENEMESSIYYWEKGIEKPQKAAENFQEIRSVNDREQHFFETVYFIKGGNIYSYSKKEKGIKKVFVTSDKIYGLTRGSNPDILYYQQNGNIYQFDTKNFTILQLTHFKKGNEPSKGESKHSYLEKQQLELFEFIKDKKKKKDRNEEKFLKRNDDLPKVFYYGNESLEQVKISPQGDFVTFRLSDYPNSKRTSVTHFISSDGYIEEETARAKVSVKNISSHKMGIYNIKKDSVYYVSFAGLTGISEHPEYYQEYSELKEKEKEEKGVVMVAPLYNQNGDRSVFELRSLDNKDRWIVSLDLGSGKINEIDHQHDEAWIGGPGIPNYSYWGGTLGFLDDGHTIYFQSEESGYSHLYTYDLKTNKKTALTKGEWEVRNVTLSNDGKSFYLTTNTTHPGNRDFYKLEIASKKMIPILVGNGAYEAILSPDEKKIAVRHSYKNKPWELYIADNKPNTSLEQITFSTTKQFEAYKWRDPQVIKYLAKDGQEVYARLYVPEENKKNNAAILFVHGAGYLQNAHNFWSSYYREYMFHNLLCDLGYTILDIDYRGSDGYGRDVRTGIYRHMGGLDLSDHLDGKKYLVENYGIDSNRVGIYGGSYGGFITLMALLTHPKEFKAGAALRSVTDWAHYNHGYTGNILNFPETDALAYRRSSPIYFAENLEDNLLMLHGMVDDNVQFQDIVRLSQRFIELGKTNWDLAIFPVEDHGFKETYSWKDEYRRILELFNKNLLLK